GSSRLVASSRGGNRLTLYDYAENQVIATLPTQGLPHLFSACFFEREGKLHAAFNHMGDPKLTIIEMEDFRIVKEIPLVGSGFFARTHPGTPYVWVDTNTETIQLVEKASLATAERSLTPEPGKQAMHVEFTADGKTAFVSVWDPQGAVVVYDAVSLEEMARLPFSMPVGKYNAGNKTRELR
ncbi:MAG: cytochrome C oxidase Cbb3, partial [Deltaproteobacteria bacterium]|nr:cytochrome C oxidase Cbb3 [Deltaproteobacteria bacterium]